MSTLIERKLDSLERFLKSPDKPENWYNEQQTMERFGVGMTKLNEWVKQCPEILRYEGGQTSKVDKIGRTIRRTKMYNWVMIHENILTSIKKVRH